MSNSDDGGAATLPEGPIFLQEALRLSCSRTYIQQEMSRAQSAARESDFLAAWSGLSCAIGLFRGSLALAEDPRPDVSELAALHDDAMNVRLALRGGAPVAAVFPCHTIDALINDFRSQCAFFPRTRAELLDMVRERVTGCDVNGAARLRAGLLHRADRVAERQLKSQGRARWAARLRMVGDGLRIDGKTIPLTPSGTDIFATLLAADGGPVPKRAFRVNVTRTLQSMHPVARRFISCPGKSGRGRGYSLVEPR